MSTPSAFPVPNGGSGSSSVFRNGFFTANINPNTAQSIPHGMGVIPKYVRFHYANSGGGITGDGGSNGVTRNAYADGSGAPFGVSGSALFMDNGAGSVSSMTGVSFDATNINITWTFGGGGFGAVAVFWEAQS